MAEPTVMQRKGLAKLGYAMPDGSYYIRAGVLGASDLQNAISAVGRGQDDSHNAIRMHIMKRAKALNLASKIPADWQADGSLKHGDGPDYDAYFLAHFGVKGMHWGVKRPSGAASSDHSSAVSIIKKAHEGGGIHTLSNDELKTLNERLNLESNHRKLTGGKEAPHKFLQDALKNEAKKEASKLVVEFAAKGAEFLTKEATKQLLGTRAGAGKHA